MEVALRISRNLTLSQKLFAVCGVYSAAAFLAFPTTFLAAAGAYPVTRYFIYIPVIMVAGLLVAGFTYQPRAPFAFMAEKMRTRGKGFALIMLALVLSAAAFTTLKHEYSLNIPFFADSALADIDHAIHFGDPWKALHMILPLTLDYPLFLLYSVMWFVELALSIVIAAMLACRYARERYFMALVVAVILLSSPVRILGSSVGPIFYDSILGSQRFADLMAVLRANPSGPDLMQVTGYLLKSYTTNKMELGTGIAAFPSLHVALAFLNALFISSLSRKAGYFAWTYFAIIQFGSVYFGWHYAVDGYISILTVAAIWMLSTKIAAKSAA